jgi:dTDP-4-amino-4,6-dideoxygalactose transaminase
MKSLTKIIESVKVPLLDLQVEYAPLRAEILAAVARVCDAQQFILGPEVEQLEAALARRIGVRHAIGVSSGTDALLVSLMALDIGPGDEVITPTFSFVATAGSVARLGATPVLVDVDPMTMMMDADHVRRAITPRTKAIVPVHLFGLCADMKPLSELASSRDIAIVEDAAQALGATAHGREAGSLGRVGCFSFFPTKNLGAFGDAGLVTTNDDALGAKIRLLRNHGASPKYHHALLGGNFRLDALQAAVLRVKLPHLEAWNDRRRQNAAVYAELFAAAGLAARITLPCDQPARQHIYHQYVVRVPDRDRVRAHLGARGVGTEVYYPVPFHRQPCFAALVPDAEVFPNADAAAREVLALPIYPGLTRDQQQHVVSCIAEAVQ